MYDPNINTMFVYLFSKMIQAIETDDMAELVKMCGLSFPEKLNLKAVINALSNKHVMCSYVIMAFLIFSHC